MVKRLLKHLFVPRWWLMRRFPAKLLGEIEAAIRDAETRHHGEICFAVEASLPVLHVLRGATGREAAIDAFGRLRVWDTERNSGVLIYLLLVDHDIEIVADRGVAAKVGQSEWDGIAREMEACFRQGDFRGGALAGVQRVGDLLALHCPAGDGNPDEFPNQPVIIG